MSNSLAVETDTALADIFSRMNRAEVNLDKVANRRRRHAEAVRTEQKFGLISPSDEESLSKVENDAHALLDDLFVEAAPLEAVYNASMWSRFFLVNNSNGHIHKSMSCSTCHPTTMFGWLPALSGLTEADAVAAQGEILCSVCFPTAPVEWTNGESKEKRDARSERYAQKAERDAKKSAKALTPSDPKTGYRTMFGHDRITTTHAAKVWLSSFVEWTTTITSREGSVSFHPSYHPEDAVMIASLMVGRPGVREATASDVLEAAWAKGLKKMKKMPAQHPMPPLPLVP